MTQNRKIVPPVYFILALATTAALHFFFPIWNVSMPLIGHLGVLFIIGGLVMGFSAGGSFRKKGTSFKHLKRPNALVTQGIYRLTRNPMYLGMALMLTGTTMLFGSVGATISIPLFILVIEVQYIRPEELILEEIFGDDYLEYKQKVRRWI